MDQIRREQHRVLATIKIASSRLGDVAAGTVENVLCKVFLPVKKTNRPLLHFLPTDEQEVQLRQPGVFGIVAEVAQPNGAHTVITADQVHIVSHTSDPWGPSQTEHLLIGEPWDLRVEHIRSPVEKKPESRTTGSFWISPNKLLANVSIRSWLQTGLTIERFAPLTVPLVGGLGVAFQVHIGHRDTQFGEAAVFDEIAAEFNMPLELHADDTIHSGMEQVEDVLRLVSFVGEYRCVCVGWQAAGSNSIREFYRPRIVDESEPPSVHEALIEYQYFSEFIEKGYEIFANLTSRVAFRRALDYVIPDLNDTLESSYVMLYAAVETLVSFFRKQNRLENIVEDETEWLQLRSDLEKWLKTHPVLASDKEKRALVKGKLSELRRTSFAYAFDRFCQYFKVDLSDLWPMTGQKEGDSLSVIRNKLVHGEVYSADRYQALMGAREHLRWSVYRMIFGMLGWQVTQTKIAPSVLELSPIHKTWEQDRIILSKEL